MPAGIEAQTEQIFDSLAAVLKEAGTGLGAVVKATVFVTDLGDFAKLNARLREALRRPQAGALEVFARAGVKDILVSNQVRDPAKIDRLAQMPKYGARTIVCVDDIDNVKDLSEAAERHSTTIECFVEIDCGAGAAA
jgi:enamine deaminase RidA (YjgF/YER057c/UK114 family)